MKLFDFIAEPVFTFIPGILFEIIPERRSESSRPDELDYRWDSRCQDAFDVDLEDYH